MGLVMEFGQASQGLGREDAVMGMFWEARGLEGQTGWIRIDKRHF